MTESCFFWGLRSPKITPAKEKEREIERVKKRNEEKRKKALVAFSVSIMTTVDFKDGF